MESQPLKFHEVHGSNIRLLDQGFEATRKQPRAWNSVCFTNRPLAVGEHLVLRISRRAARSTGGDVGAGFTERDPRELKPHLLTHLRMGFNLQTGCYGRVLRAHGDSQRMNVDFVIYFDESRESLMIRGVDYLSSEFTLAVTTKKPVFMIFDFLDNTGQIRIRSFVVSLPRAISTAHQVPSVLQSEAFRDSPLESAAFAVSELPHPMVLPHTAKSSAFTVRANFAAVDTLLKPGRALIVKLKALKRLKPIRVVLTTEAPHRIYSCGYLSILCNTTYSNFSMSDIPREGDEVAVRISSRGAVSISHNNRGWLQRSHVDAKLEYRVVFCMKDISEISMIGMMPMSDDIHQVPAAVTHAPRQETKVKASSDCIVCLENAREVIVLPCYHYALCEGCAWSLHRSKDATCPLCRVRIIDIKRIFQP